MKDNLEVILGTLAVVVLIVIAALLATQALDDDDDVAAQGAITLPISEMANTVESDAHDTDQLDNGEVVDAEDIPLSKSELERAEAVALRVAGGGVVTDIDRSDDIDEAYEVEVVGAAGEVDIALNDRFERVPKLRYDD